MPAAADLILYAALNVPDLDTGNSGGAIDTLRYLDFTQLAADDDLEVVSSAAGDTSQTVTVEGRKADGTVASQTVTLNGTTAVGFNTLGVVNRVLSMELSATAAGIVTLRRQPGGATVRAIPIGKRGFKMIFRKTASDPSVIKNYYQKGFWKNEHASQALVNAKVKQNADPDARITHLLAATKDDTAVSTNRVTAPAAVDTQDPDTFDDTDKTVPGNDLGATQAIGVWFRLQLPAADTAHRTTYTTELSGESI
jgi:hypothetical protein